MSICKYQAIYPDLMTVPSELSFDGIWNSAAVSELIRSKCDYGQTPAFLFLGRNEAKLLKEHLSQAWGPESVVTLKHSYYMGLEVVTIDCESFLATGGRKAIRAPQNPISHRPVRRDSDVETLWKYRM